jgi:uncharacterized protein with PIN domain
MITRGMVVDSNLAKLGKMLQQKGVDCKILTAAESGIASQIAHKENRVYITSNLRVFNQSGTVPRGCVHFKATPYSKLVNDNKFYRSIIGIAAVL